VFIFIYGAYTAWGLWEIHIQKVQESNVNVEILERKIIKLQKEKKQVKSFLKDIEKAKEKIKLVEEEVRKLQKKLPSKIVDTENLSLLKVIGDSLNIRNIFLAPGVEDNRGFYIAKKYDLTATGTYLQFLLLFEKLSTTEQLFNVVSIDLKKSDVQRRGRYQLINAKLSIESYRYNPDYKEKTISTDGVNI
jgi:Tfp pilus assembly protein PilO